MSAKVTDHDSRIEDREREKGHEFTEKFDRNFWKRLRCIGVLASRFDSGPRTLLLSSAGLTLVHLFYAKAGYFISRP